MLHFLSAVHTIIRISARLTWWCYLFHDSVATVWKQDGPLSPQSHSFLTFHNLTGNDATSFSKCLASLLLWKKNDYHVIIWTGDCRLMQKHVISESKECKSAILANTAAHRSSTKVHWTIAWRFWWFGRRWEQQQIGFFFCKPGKVLLQLTGISAGFVHMGT